METTIVYRVNSNHFEVAFRRPSSYPQGTCLPAVGYLQACCSIGRGPNI